MLALLLMTQAAREASAASKLPDPRTAAVAARLYRLDCGHSLANDESVWTPGENVGASIEFSSTWSTLPKLIVYHLDRSLTDQLAEIGLKPGDIGRVAISHTHGDHIGNMRLFESSTILS